MPDTPDLNMATELRAEQETNLLLQETIADLELALEDRSWNRLTTDQRMEFSAQGRKMLRDLCRTTTVVNPLVKRGMMLRISYIWGGGVEVTARDENVQETVQQFWDDNQRSLTSSQAQEELERALGTDGNVFLAAFTNPLTGRVQVRSVNTDEIVDVKCNPDDHDEPWFYCRTYTRETFAPGETPGATQVQSEVVHEVYPALGYAPATRIKNLDGAEVKWDAPMIHIAVNRLDGWTYGVPDVYASMAWARAYKDFLTDWALLTKSLAKFAWRVTGDTKSRATKAIEAIRSSVDASSPALPLTQANTAGQIAGSGPGMNLEAVSTSGAHIDAGSGKPLAAMVASGLGVSVVSLLADPGVTGARAVAETLDKPTVLEMTMRRMLWQGQLNQLLDYVIDQAVLAPKGGLKGTSKIDAWERRVVTVAGGDDRTVDWNWPALDGVPPLQMIQGIVAGAEYLPHENVTRLLLNALGVTDVDEVIKEMQDSQGNFVPPAVSAGQAAADAAKRGEDPAGMGRQPGDAVPKAPAREALIEADHVYHWKHGWIPLDHSAAPEAGFPHMANWDDQEPATFYLDRLKEIGPRAKGDAKGRYIDAVLSRVERDRGLTDKEKSKIRSLASQKRGAVGGTDGGIPALKRTRETFDPNQPRDEFGKWFHGSSHEFKPGDLIQPRSVTGAQSWAEQLGLPDSVMGPHYRPDHVYLTPNRAGAMDFGHYVYQVEPVGDVVRDPENTQGLDWWRSDRPLRVVRKVVSHNRPLGT